MSSRARKRLRLTRNLHHDKMLEKLNLKSQTVDSPRTFSIVPRTFWPPQLNFHRLF